MNPCPFPARALGAIFLLTATCALAQEGEAPDRRPPGSSVGIGAGWVFPQDILEPNIASVRFRLGKVTFAPSIQLGGDGTTSSSERRVQLAEEEPVLTQDEDRVSGLNLQLGASVRYAVAARGPLDLVLIGGLGLGRTSETRERDLDDPTTRDRTVTTGLNASLGWGLGIDWFLGRGVALSVDARNPLVGWSSSERVDEDERDTTLGRAVSRTETSSSQVNWGLTFRPTIRAMVHLYF